MTERITRSALLGECARIAGTQHGVIRSEQALAAGLSRSAMYRLSDSGFWGLIHPGVFSLWTPREPSDRFRQRLAAAALWLRGRTGISHRAAGVLWQLEGVRTAPIELTTTGRRRSDGSIIIHHVRSLPNEHLVIREGIPVTSIERTLLDLAGVLRSRALELALDSAFRAGHVTRTQMADLLRRSSRTSKGIGSLRSMLDERSDRQRESALEVLVERALLDGGLPRPVRQFEIYDQTGTFVGRADFAYPDALLAIEADGFASHSIARDWQRDRTRQNVMTTLGWTVYRPTWEDATKRPAIIVRDVGTLLDAAKRRRTLQA